VVLAERPAAAAAASVPVLAFPEDAGRALGRAADYARWRRERRERARLPDGIDANAAAAVLAEALGRGQEWLGRAELVRLARAYGLHVAPAGHRTAPAGAELGIGVTQDPSFGAVVACGIRDAPGAPPGDVAARLLPLDAGDPEEMLRPLPEHPALAGQDGVRAVADVVHRVAALADAHPEVRELVAAPVLREPGGAVIGRLRVRVEPAAGPAWTPDSVRDAA
jgi:hypothetical protein